MGTLETAIHYFLLGSMICLAVMIFLCLIRAIQGPRITDRIVSINMIGTMVIITICMLSIYLKESYLVDVALIYAMISFLAVIVLCRVFTGVHMEQQKEKEKKEAVATPVETLSKSVEERDEVTIAQKNCQMKKGEERC